MSQPSHPASIDRDYIRLLQAMRRFVKEEFAVSLRMTQDDAIEQLLHYAGQSRNHVLQEMASELESYAGHMAEEPAANESNPGEPQGKVRYYRGAAIAVEQADEQNQEKESAERVSPSRPKKIYRGQVIN